MDRQQCRRAPRRHLSLGAPPTWQEASDATIPADCVRFAHRPERFRSAEHGPGRGGSFGRGSGRTRFEARDRDDSRIVLRRDRQIVFGGFTTRSGRPPGWDRGRKTGWGNCDVPPGQAKKFACSGFVVRGHDRVRDRSVIVLPIR